MRDSLLSSEKARPITAATARRDAKRIRARWVADIVRRGRQEPTQRFANLRASEFRRRLDAAAARYDLTVKSVRLLHPRQVAPLVIVQTHHDLALARAIPAIEKSLDPHTGHNDQRGWAFEAFLFEAQDERGVPFVVIENAFRGGNGYGGQWARSEALFPFAHG